MVVGTHLNRAISRVVHQHGEGAAPRVEGVRARIYEQFAWDHGTYFLDFQIT